jgi:hypothetical protein
VRIALVSLSLLLPAALAQAGTAGESLTAPGTIGALAFETPPQIRGSARQQLAYVVDRSGSDCDRVRIWSRASRRSVRMGRSTPCDETSTGRGISSLSLAGNRVLWLHFAGGNIREWSLFTATTAAPRPRRLRSLARDVDADAPIVLGEGEWTRDSALLPYAVEREVIVLHSSGARAFRWEAPARVTALGAKDGGLAVALDDGRIVVLSLLLKGPESSWAGSPAADAVFLTGSGVAAQRGRTVEMRTGSETRRWLLPPDGHLSDADGYRAVYVSRGRVKLLHLDSGRTRDLGPGSNAELEYSTVAIAAGRHVRFVRIR